MDLQPRILDHGSRIEHPGYAEPRIPEPQQISILERESVGLKIVRLEYMGYLDKHAYINLTID